ncbi:MAG: hypothetical protein ABI647_23545 [Gemmatimonadota bacterium]
MSQPSDWDRIQALTRRLDAICREAEEIRNSLRAIVAADEVDDGMAGLSDDVVSLFTQRREASEFASVKFRPEDQN